MNRRQKQTVEQPQELIRGYRINKLIDLLRAVGVRIFGIVGRGCHYC